MEYGNFNYYKRNYCRLFAKRNTMKYRLIGLALAGLMAFFTSCKTCECPAYSRGESVHPQGDFMEKQATVRTGGAEINS